METATLKTKEKPTSLEKNDNTKEIEEIAELIKSEGIGQVIIHGRETYDDKGKKTDDLLFDSDLDAKMALALLNDYNTLSSNKLYTEGATSSIVPMGGSKKNLDYKNPNGVRVFLDVGGEWLKIEKDGETKTIYIDHHGQGKRNPTSATKMVYEILEKANLLKEKPEWLKNCVNFVNDIDNLSYLENKNEKGEKIFNENYFKYKWPRTPYGLASELSPETILELFKTGKIKDGMKPFTRNEIENGDIGKLEVTGIDSNGNTFRKTIKEIALGKQKQAIFNSNAIRQSKKYADVNGLNLKMKSFQGNQQEMIFHDFPKVVNAKGKEYTNKFINNMAYLAAQAQGYGGIIVWNPKKIDKKFFVNINSPEMERIGKELDKVAPGTNEVRGTFIFSPKDNPENAEKITKEQFLNIISPAILKNATIIKSGIEKNENEGVLVLSEKEELEVKKVQKIDKGNEFIYEEENKEETLETKEGEPVDMEKLGKKALKDDPEMAQKEAKEKIEKSIKNELAEKEREQRKNIEAGFQIKLEEARMKYAQAYKDFMTKRKEKTGFFKNTWRKIVGSKVKDEEVPESLKNLENEYTRSATLFGQTMYKNMQEELALSDLPAEKHQELLLHFKQRAIFEKVVIEEEEKLSALKAENLPPKEKALWKKGLDWYLKQNRFTKIALSTGLSTVAIAAFLPSMVAAGGGIAAFFASKYGRAVIGGTIGQIAVKGYDVAIKERYTERKEVALEELQKKFGENMSDKDLIEYKKEYAAILEKEKVSKRNRLIHKAGIAMLAGGLAAYEAGNIAHSFSDTQVLENGIGPKNITPEHLFKAEQVQFSSRGAIQTIENLKIKIHADYPDISKAPHSIQEFMKTNSTQEAIKLGFYNPNNPSGAESAMLVKGSTLGFDEHGNLSYHDIRTGQTHNLITEQNNLETTQKFDGKMFDSDHSGQHNVLENNNFENQRPINIDGSLNNLNGEHITNIDSSLNNLNGEHITNIDNALTNHIDPTQNLGRLGHINFENSDHVVSINENGSSLKMQFLYDKNGNVTNVDVGGNYNSTEINQYVIESEVQKLGEITRIDAHRDIFQMTYEARFLSKLPRDTYEYKFLHERIAQMQKDIISNYGHVLNPEKLEGDFYPIETTPENINVSQNIPPENIVDLAEKTNTVYKTSINHIFPNKESMGIWNQIKDSRTMSADRVMSGKIAIMDDEGYPIHLNKSHQLVMEMNKLQEVTGLSPIPKTEFYPAETTSEYILRAMKKAAEMGKLEEVKL